MKSRNYFVAISKMNQFSNTNQFCGCITPSEAVELLDVGCIATDHYDDYMRSRKAKGDSKPSWFYCIPTNEVKYDILNKLKVKPKEPK